MMSLMRFKKTTLLISLALTLLLNVVPSPSFGQGGAISPSIGVSPTKFLESIQPGKISEFTMSLRNFGQDPLPLSGSIQGISTIQDTGVPVFTDQITPHSAQSWLEVSGQDVIISPGEQKQVKVTAQPPTDLSPGSYQAAVIFQAKLPSYYFDLDSDTRVLPAISVLLFLTVESDNLPTVESLEVASLQVPKIVVSTPLSVVAQIQNPSNFYVQADATTTIKGGINNKSDKEEIGRVMLLPDGLRKFVSAYNNKLLPGIYTASIELKQGDKILVASAKFVALPWQFLVWFFLATFIILFLAFRRRFRHAYRILVGKDPIKPNKSRLVLR